MISIFTLIIAAIGSASANAQELGFEKVWRTVSQDSKAQKAAQLTAEAAEEAASRTSRHWLPRVYLGAQSYRTNRAGANFVGLLEQRAVTTPDFLVDALNNPGSHFLTQGALGVDLPIFEGGFSVAQAEGAQHLRQAAHNDFSAALVRQYAETAVSYGTILVLGSERAELELLRTSIANALERYEVGSRSNPLGYSGLLGLRTLANRLEGILTENASKAQGRRAVLAEMGMGAVTWSPMRQDFLVFTKRYFSLKPEHESWSLAGEMARAQAARSYVAMERSRYFPRMGIFAEQSLSQGARSTATGYSAGLYLQWNIFDPSSFGMAKEARLRAAAVENFVLASAERERAEKKALLEGASALRKNVELMEQSGKMLAEQTKIAESLFRNGSINALQFVETLSRRADLISAVTQAKISLLEAEAERITKEKFIVPAEGSRQ